MNNRIEYLDAMRGLLMLLVVMWHVKLYSIGVHDTFSFNDVFFLFLMPAFFFISGFVGRRKEENSAGEVMKWVGLKFLRILLPTLIFMFLWGFGARWSIHQLVFDVSKGGFWFTILLPFYCLIYALLFLVFKKGLKLGDTAFGIVHVVIGLLIYLGTAFLVSPYNPVRNDAVNSLLSVVHFRYYLFFSLGVTAATFREKYLKWCENAIINAVLICLFLVGCGLYFQFPDKLLQTLLLILIGAAGTHILFAFFYQYRTHFVKTTFIGKSLQYTGVRTLDIYLLHLFILPVRLKCIGAFFEANPNPLIELVITLAIATLVVLGCLLISKILRLSDLLAKVLFGKVLRES